MTMDFGFNICSLKFLAVLPPFAFKAGGLSRCIISGTALLAILRCYDFQY